MKWSEERDPSTNHLKYHLANFTTKEESEANGFTVRVLIWKDLQIKFPLDQPAWRHPQPHHTHTSREKLKFYPKQKMLTLHFRLFQSIIPWANFGLSQAPVLELFWKANFCVQNLCRWPTLGTVGLAPVCKTLASTSAKISRFHFISDASSSSSSHHYFLPIRSLSTKMLLHIIFVGQNTCAVKVKQKCILRWAS